MNKKFKLTAQKTLDITQQLREKYKAITYNRSDCSYLSDEQFSEAPQVIDALKSVFDQPMNVDTTRKSKAFDSAKVTAHTAIIPTANVPDINALTPDERNVYLAIAQHYLVQFMPEKLY
ncbi:type IA DNA topoisomerase, partial [Escherichia coli]|nr:type IA DNA topoisomerase [Escherichia coli]